jgi:hypothetical protein
MILYTVKTFLITTWSRSKLSLDGRERRMLYAAWSSGIFEVARAGNVRRGLGDPRAFTVKIGARRERKLGC